MSRVDLSAPCAITLFRWRLESLRRGEGDASPQAAMALVAPPVRPLVRLGLTQARRRIDSVKTVGDLVALAGFVPPPVEAWWLRAVAAAGSEEAALALVPALVAWGEEPRGGELRAQHLAGAFLWLDGRAHMALLDRFRSLASGAKGYAAVALGLAHCLPAADEIWSLWQDAVSTGPHEALVAALWGLSDLRDARAATAVATLLDAGECFYELPGLVGKIGDETTVAPLLSRLDRATEQQERLDWLAALGAIAARIGPGAVEQAIVRELGSGERAMARELVALVTSHLRVSPHEYFGAFGV